ADVDQCRRSGKVAGVHHRLCAQQVVLGGGDEGKSALVLARVVAGLAELDRVFRPLVGGEQVSAPVDDEAVVVRLVPGVRAIGLRRLAGDPTIGGYDVEAVTLRQWRIDPRLVRTRLIRRSNRAVVPT